MQRQCTFVRVNIGWVGGWGGNVHTDNSTLTLHAREFPSANKAPPPPIVLYKRVSRDGTIRYAFGAFGVMNVKSQQCNVNLNPTDLEVLVSK